MVLLLSMEFGDWHPRDDFAGADRESGDTSTPPHRAAATRNRPKPTPTTATRRLQILVAVCSAIFVLGTVLHAFSVLATTLGEPISAVSRTLDRAASLLAASDGSGALSQHYGRSLFALQAALCHAEAGQASHAVEMYDAHLSPEQFSPRDHAYFSSLQALSLADAGYPEKACNTALAALPVAQEVGSQRTLSELARLPDRLRHWRSRSVVRDTVQEITLAVR